MSTKVGNLTLGIFSSPDQVERVLKQLRQADFQDATVGILARNHETIPHTEADSAHAAFEQKILQRASSGAVFGLGIKGTETLPLAKLIVPTIGPVAVGGFMATLVTDGALAGGVIGALIRLGLPLRFARQVEQALLEGQIIVKVCSETRQAEVAAILDECGAHYADASEPVVQPA